jgi:hypothetical protein
MVRGCFKVPGQVREKVPRANPSERLRVNALNRRLLTVDGTMRMQVCPVNAPHVCDDFDSVTTLPGTMGELDKVRDANLTHLSDAVGYYCIEKFGPGGGASLNIHDGGGA